MEPRTDPNTVTVSQEASIRTLLASLSTHPLLSIVAAAYVLVLLYLPRYLLSFLLSPAAVSTLLLLLLLASLLHFGSSARLVPQTPPSETQHHVHSETEQQQHVEKRQHLWTTPPCGPVPSFPHKPMLWSDQPHFAELIRRGPLEVIYEEYEGEEDDGVDSPPGSCQSPVHGRRQALEGLELLGMRFCADDSGEDSLSECSGAPSSPGWDSPEKLCFQWEVEEDGLIEISLEEDNLIEIDLSACR